MNALETPLCPGSSNPIPPWDTNIRITTSFSTGDVGLTGSGALLRGHANLVEIMENERIYTSRGPVYKRDYAQILKNDWNPRPA